MTWNLSLKHLFDIKGSGVQKDVLGEGSPRIPVWAEKMEEAASAEAEKLRDCCQKICAIFNFLCVCVCEKGKFHSAVHVHILCP